MASRCASRKGECRIRSELFSFNVSALNVERWYVEGEDITGDRLGEARYS